MGDVQSLFICGLFPSSLIFETFTRAVCGLVIKDQLKGGMDPAPVFFPSIRMNENCLALAQCGSMIGREAKRRYESISFLLLSFIFMV